MARSLRVHVQVDRLPDVDGFVQLGLRVSAAIEPEVTGDPPVLVEAAKDGDEKFILPWLWKKADGTPWDPHLAAAWKVYHFRVADQTLLPVAADKLRFLDPNQAGVPQFDPSGIFRQRIDGEVAGIVRAFGPRQAFEVPAHGVISGRTVYGLAESLTSLPNPVPAAMKVWTAAAIKQVDLDTFDPKDLFLAVPVFAAAGAAYEPKDPVLANGQGTADFTRTGGEAVEAKARIHPSLPVSRLEIGDNPQRLIDLFNLTIRAKKGEEFEGADWIASVGTRIAEAIDPAARAMAVLDTTIEEVVREQALQNLTTTRGALVADMTGEEPKDRFRTALRELHRPIVTLRARRSGAATAPAASFLEMLAMRTPQLWPTVVPMLFAQAGAEDRSSTPAALQFAAASCARLLGAAGVPPSPELKTVDAVDAGSGAASRRIPTLDSESEFVDWLGGHWLTFPGPAESMGDRSFEGTLRVLRGKPPTPVAETFEPVGVADFARVSQDTVIPIQFSAIAGQEFPCVATVVWERPQDQRPGGSVAIELSFAGDKTTIKVDGVAQGGDLPKLTEARLAFSVTAGAQPTLSISYKPKESTDPILLAIDPSARVLSGRMGIRVNTTKKIKLGIDPTAFVAPAIDRERLVPQAQALRAALSWAYAGPVVPGLLQGWVPIPGRTVTETGTDPLGVRLPAALEKFIEASFKSVFDKLASGISDNADDPLRKLFERLRDAAIRDARRLAHAIVPPALGDSDRVTEDALPLAFLISQLQDFDENDDLWGRLAGVGVLISRDDQLAANEWWSLNAASLHVAKPGANGREPLTKDTVVLTASLGGGDEPWKKASKVDPVPLSVGDVSGVRSALIKYENHSLVGEVEGAPQLDPAGPAAGPRRPEAFLFPPTNFTRMPALTFGRTYGILPYLIGHGGALPVPLRKDKLNPVKLKDLDAEDKLKITESLGEPGMGYIYERKTKYLRTVPVGAPRLAGPQWPGTFPGVDPLADELPLRPAALTLKQDAEARFFRDQQRLTGLLSSREPAIRIEIGEITNADANASLVFRVDMRNSAGVVATALKVEVAIAKLRAQVGTADFIGLRIEAGRTADPELSVLRRREHEHADDEPEAKPLTKGVDFTGTLATPVERWDSAYLVVSAKGGAFDFEPPTIRWATKGAADQPLVLAGDRPLLPPEVAHAARKVAVLDGIRVGGKTGPASVRLNLRRPSTPVSTWERWINGPTGKYGTNKPEEVKTIRDKINKARARAADIGRGDRSFDDPAVEAIFVEVVQLFPRRALPKITTAKTAATPGPVMVRKLTPDDLDQKLRFDDPQFATLDVKVTPDPALLPIPDEDTRVVGNVNVDPTKNTLDLFLVPGCVYEIRVYGAVPEKQDHFAPVPAANRFSPAVRASWRDVRDANGKPLWHLGTPLTLTVEVATEIMPECWPRKGREIDFDRPAFALDLARPPAVVEDRALVRLVPEHIGPPVIRGNPEGALRYAASRYVNRAALMHQRWSWRGRPHPQLVLDASPRFGTKGKQISDGLGQFVDAAFLGRADDDIGAIREAAFGRAHAVGRQDVVNESSTKPENRPVLLEHDLDRRAGTHLWRFALRLKSRYAAMRPNHPDLLRFSHLQKDSSLTRWWRVVVPDRTHPGRAPRGIDRPSLMLVLPLTEPLMTAGSVPPLLAVFNQEMFPQFNAADGMEAVIDVARHPFPGIERIDKEKKPETATKTYEERLQEAWGAVAEKRRLLVDAEAAYAKSFALSSATMTAEQEQEKIKRDAAAKEVARVEEALKAIQAKGEAWGEVEQWDDVRTQVEEALANASTEAEKERLQKRLDVDIPAEKDRAQKFAEGLENGTITLPIVAGAPANPFTKYFQEFSPDTMREATPAGDRPVAIRVDGPVGYTFDVGTEAGRFDHAALLVSPVAEVVRPGSFMRLRFRRLETPGLLVAAAKPDPTWPDEPPAGLNPPLSTLPAEGARFLVARHLPDGPLAADDTVYRFETAYDGLAFEIAGVAKDNPVELRFKLVSPVGDEPCADGDPAKGTTVFAKIEKNNIIVSARTHLGPSSEWSLPLSDGARADLQIIVSLRPKPNTGPDANVQEYTPVGDVSVRVRIQSDRDLVRRAQDRTWLSVLCMPLTTLRKFTDLVAVRVCPTGKPPDIGVKPLRLSDFAPAVWCQFAAVMSRFKVSAETSAPRSIVDVLPVSALDVELDPARQTFKMGLKGLRKNETLTKLTLRTEGHPADEPPADGVPETRAQIEEPVYAVVTRFVYDAFDRLRERAIGIHPLEDNSLLLGRRIWPPGKEEDRELYEKGMRGRVRFLRVVRGKLREQGGFETRPQEFPRDFFGAEKDEALDADPLDAAGMVIGISAPIDWSSDS